MRIVDRVYHTISTHTQVNARWSYTDPPLAQTPRDLRYIYKPDPDWPWITWDHDQIELRLVAANCKDATMLEGLEKGWDLHLLACCAMFKLPLPPELKDPIHAEANADWRTIHHWQPCQHETDLCGKDDIRRVFAKQFGHRQSYGGTPKKAGNIPGAKKLGLTSKDLLQMSQNRAAMFPGLNQWQSTVVADGSRTGTTRTWDGRRRRYLGRGTTYLKGEMLDHPMQAGVQGIETVIFLAIADYFKMDALYKFGMHDSQTWAFYAPRYEEAKLKVRELAQPTITIAGTSMYFPASFKERLA